MIQDTMISLCHSLVDKDLVRKQYDLLCKPAKLNSMQIKALITPELDNSFYRMWDYIKENPSVLYKVTTCNGKSFTAEDLCAYGSAALCGAVIPGSKSLVNAGAVWCPIFEVLTVPPGVEVVPPSIGSVAVGVAIAVSVVATINITRNVINLYSSEELKVWGHIRKQTLIKMSRIRVLTEDDVLKDFVCPILGDIPDCPMRAPNHCTYDKRSIKKFIKENPSKCPPGGSILFDKSSLMFDFPYANTVLMRLEELIKTVKAVEKAPLLEDFCHEYQLKRDLLSEKRMNSIGSSFSPIVECLAKTPQNAADNQRNREVVLKYIGRAERNYSRITEMRRVKVCTNTPFELLLISAFGWLGLKKSMKEVDVMPDDFKEISDELFSRKGIVEPIKPVKIDEVKRQEPDDDQGEYVMIA